jgi:lipopolysaccharide transport system ATP-binding protein
MIATEKAVAVIESSPWIAARRYNYFPAVTKPMSTVISVEHVSKAYRLGVLGAASLKEDFARWWARARGKADPFVKIGEEHHARRIGEQFWALDDISFEVKEGEVLGIIGRNGAGKSTLLKILSQVTAPTSGEIKIKGRIGSLLEVGTGFHPELTGRENTFLNGAILGMTKAEIRRKFDEIVAFSGLEEFIDTPVKRYSSGMYVRLAFAVAAHLEPEILIVDEVLAVGDMSFQKKCLGKMEDISRKGRRTVLFVSHNMSAVSTLCQRVIVLNDGAIIFNGATDEAIRRYAGQSQAVAEARVDLAARKVERYGAKEYACLRSLELLNAGGISSTILQMGEKAMFRLAIDILKPSDDFEIGIVITNFQGVAVHYLVSGWEGLHSIRELGLHLVEVELPSVYLFPGEYQINVWIAIRGQYYDDAVHEALRFSVEEGRVNPHPTYFSRFSKGSQVYTPSHWKVSKLDPAFSGFEHG